MTVEFAAIAAMSTVCPAPADAAVPVRPATSCVWVPTGNSRIPATYNAIGVNIRTAPSTGCTAVGVGYPGHALTLHCQQVGYDNFLWDYLTDTTTGKTGWSRDSYIAWTGGPLIGC